MVNRPPLKNLGPAEQWGKWAENSVLAMERDTNQQFQAIDRSLAGVNASIRALTDQIEALALVQSQIPLVYSVHEEYTGAIPTGNFLTQSIDFPPGKTNCNIFAAFTSNFAQPSGGSGALRRTRLNLGGVLGPWASWYLNVSGTTPIVFMSGTFGTSLSIYRDGTTPIPTIDVSINADSGLSGGVGLNPTAVLDFIAIFS